MVTKCKDCGKCCLDTEMPISMQDINMIERNYPVKISIKQFTERITSSHYQLRNIYGHCYFFNNKENLCNIYEYRPQGCRYYPIIYDYEKKKCVFDNFCPRNSLFFLDIQELKITCRELRKFLLEELKII